MTVKDLEGRVSELISAREKAAAADSAKEAAVAEAARYATMLSNLEARLQVGG